MKQNFSYKLSRVWDNVYEGLWAHIPHFIILSVFLIAYISLLDNNDIKVGYSFSNVIWNILKKLPGVLVFFILLSLIGLAFTKSRKRAIMRAFHWLASLNWAEIVFLRVPVAFFFMSAINHILLSFKINIPNFAPYSWDLFFAKVDRILFFGIDPWVLTHQMLPHILHKQQM